MHMWQELVPDTYTCGRNWFQVHAHVVGTSSRHLHMWQEPVPGACTCGRNRFQVHAHVAGTGFRCMHMWQEPILWCHHCDVRYKRPLFFFRLQSENIVQHSVFDPVQGTMSKTYDFCIMCGSKDSLKCFKKLSKIYYGDEIVFCKGKPCVKQYQEYAHGWPTLEYGILYFWTLDMNQNPESERKVNKWALNHINIVSTRPHRWLHLSERNWTLMIFIL